MYTVADPDDYNQFNRKNSKFPSLRKKVIVRIYIAVIWLTTALILLTITRLASYEDLKYFFFDSFSLKSTAVFPICEGSAAATIKRRRKKSDLCTCVFFHLPDSDFFCGYLNRALIFV